MSAAALSQDIWLEIIRKLSLIDVLAIQQTCRVLHAYASTDYVWHQLQINLPLDLPQYVPIKSLPASEIKRLAVRALRLEWNWRKPISQITKSTRIQFEDVIYNMQMLGSQWLLTLSRANNGSLGILISLWCLRDVDNPRRTAQFEIPEAFKFHATIQKGGNEVLIAIIVRVRWEELFNIYTIPLDDPDSLDPASLSFPKLLLSIPHPAPPDGSSTDIFSDVHVCGHLAAVGIKSRELFTSRDQVLVVNTLTGVRLLINLHHFVGLSHLQFRIFADHVFIIGEQLPQELVARLYPLPDYITSLDIHPELDISLKQADDLGPSFVEYIPYPLPPKSEVLLSTGSATHICSLAFQSFGIYPYPVRSSHHVTHYPLGADIHTRNTTKHISGTSFHTPPDITPELYVLGASGHRAVWLQKSWDLDEFKFIKMTWIPGAERPLHVWELFPLHMALPFQFEGCRSMAFDEASNRLCLWFISRELFILDF